VQNRCSGNPSIRFRGDEAEALQDDPSEKPIQRKEVKQ
jgi:hypothetical protein